MNTATPGSRVSKAVAGLWLLRKEVFRAPVIVPDTRSIELDGGFQRIRCPLCFWQPNATSLWCCRCINTPEPFFKACGTVWNTFTTGGKCPGCQHQWKWTGCLQCEIASLHEDWYVEEDDGGSI